LRAAPRADPSVRNYRTGLLPWVRASKRTRGKGCWMRAGGNHRAARWYIRVQVRRDRGEATRSHRASAPREARPRSRGEDAGSIVAGCSASQRRWRREIRWWRIAHSHERRSVPRAGASIRYAADRARPGGRLSAQSGRHARSVLGVDRCFVALRRAQPSSHVDPLTTAAVRVRPNAARVDQHQEQRVFVACHHRRLVEPANSRSTRPIVASPATPDSARPSCGCIGGTEHRVLRPRRARRLVRRNEEVPRHRRRQISDRATRNSVVHQRGDLLSAHEEVQLSVDKRGDRDCSGFWST
jgi:hypothetical protein